MPIFTMFNLKSILGSFSSASVKEVNVALVQKAKSEEPGLDDISYVGMNNNQILEADKASKIIAEANALALAQAKAKKLAEDNERKLTALMEARDKALADLAAANAAAQIAIEKEVLAEVMLQESSPDAMAKLAELKSQAIISREEIKRRLMSKSNTTSMEMAPLVTQTNEATSNNITASLIPMEMKKPLGVPNTNSPAFGADALGNVASCKPPQFPTIEAE